MSNSSLPKIVGVINFHGLNLLVVEYDGVEYIYAKPLADLAGLAWRSAKKAIIEGDNVKLYGTVTLKHPSFVAGGHASMTQSDGIYIRLDRARMYLARINTKHMRAQGNVDAADNLLNLQVEWAEALHAYETKGIALKESRKEEIRQSYLRLKTLLASRKDAGDVKEKQAITSLINEELEALGVAPDSYDDPQGELEV